MTSRARRTAPLWLVILAVSLPMFMATLDNLVVTTALPVLRTDLDASLEELQWFVNAYTLSFASLMLMAVSLGDRWGRKRLFAIGIVVFTVFSVACALATEPWMLVAARALQGAGAAALMPLSLTLLAGSVPDRLRPLAIGIWGGVSGLGVALGPLIGGLAIESWSWHAIFWINLPVGIVALPLVLFVLPESFGRSVRPDVVGLLLAGLGVFAIVFAVVRGNEAGWSSPEITVPLVAGALLLAGFLAWERRTRDPLVPLRLFRSRSFSVANGIGLTFSFGIFGAIFILIQFLQVVQGHTPLEAGVMTMPWTLAPMVVAPLAGIVAPRVGTRLLIVVGLVFLVISLVWLAFTMSPTVEYVEMLPAFLFGGVGMGLVFAPSSTAVLADIVDADRATASGTNSTIREIGVALGVAVLTAVFSGAGGQLTPTGYVDAAVPAILVGAGALVLALLIALALPAGRLARSPRPAGDETAAGGRTEAAKVPA
ncbi:DHA2 family efflux MFS transporter permease subunit [Compostimonas suwonensis]|uniref:EmrB/QacA subfamily drug resistance transporter n=1 Tax=Compostimonas suwonensis TaxID=1048394 RepID=A0A2M9BU90_9MICO|nr:DHA2 family efflux MFS transporter permease subunit [Compostimonas suwonensis]PJJ61517.1 EmrB/QacA subfamily drug resistance transporter [Compostimonas suwonensis]